DMDVSLDKNKREAIIVGTTGAGNIGEVYVYAPATTGMAWKAQLIGADYNVLAVAFSPTFTNDEGIFAVSVNATTPRTRVSASFGNTQDGGGWGDSVGHATLRGTVVGTANANATATRARIAFPDDFNVDSLGSNFAFVGTVADVIVTEPTGAAAGGDLYKIVFQPTLSVPSRRAPTSILSMSAAMPPLPASSSAPTCGRPQ
ncbi:MAG: hypothetical protein HYU85_04140, partial [Chloroflexi bacterium]|nr:hypothetical protein [Chloroflexota bacterium]